MSDLFFEMSWNGLLAALIVCGVIAIIWRWARDFWMPGINFPNVQAFKKSNRGLRASAAMLPRYLLLAALALLLIALIDPHFFVEREKDPDKKRPEPTEEEIPTEGIAVYLVLDRSGSMRQEIVIRDLRGRQKISKLDFLRRTASSFVTGRPNDMIGLIAFARGASVLSPLTLDHAAIQKQLNDLGPITDQNFDGTAIGYAIFKAANLISATRHYAEELSGEGKPPYEIKSAAMVLVTDGLQEPNPLDKDHVLRNIELADAAKYAKEQNVKIYLINVEPKIGQNKYKAHRSVMRKVAETTGGKFYMLSYPEQLPDVFADIDRIEKSLLPQKVMARAVPKDQMPHRYRRISLYPWLIFFAALCVLVSVVLEGTVLKRVP